MADNEVLVRLKMKAEEFSRELDQAMGEIGPSAQKAGEDAGTKFSRGMKLKLAAGLATLTSGALLTRKLVGDALDFGSELDSASREIGIGVERLQELRFAAQETGVEARALDGHLAKLTLQIGKANEGGRTAQQAFVDLGIGFETTTGQARTTEAVFDDVIARLNGIEDPTERARLGTQLLGEEYRRLEPLVQAGAEGIAAATAEVDQFGYALSAEEIQNLQDTNAKIEQMKTVLSVRIAGVVAENSDAIIALGTELANFASEAIRAAGAWIEFQNAFNQREALFREAGGRQNLSGAEEQAINARVGYRATPAQSGLFGFLNRTFDTDAFKKAEIRPDGNYDDVSYITDAGQKELDYLLRRGGGSDPAAAQVAAPPRLSPISGRGGRARSGGRSGGARQSQAERERERSAKAAARAEEQFASSVARTLKAQEDSAAVEAIRADQGEAAAAAEEARLAFLRQHPEAAAQTVEELAKALEIEGELTAEKRAQYEAMIGSADLAEKQAAAAAREAVEQRDLRAARQNEERMREGLEEELALTEDLLRLDRIRAEQGPVAAAAEEARLGFLRQHPLAIYESVEALGLALGYTREQIEADRERLGLLIEQGDAAEAAVVSDAALQEQKRLQEEAVRDVADLYETLFTDGVDGVWDSFRRQGLRIVSEIAAQWTLSLISGQTNMAGGGGGGLGLLSPLAGLFGGGAANDNGAGAGWQGTNLPPGIGGPLQGAVGGGGAGGIFGGLSAGGGLNATPLGLYAAGVTLANGIGEGIEDLTGLEYSKTGGMFGGLLGGFIGGAFKSTKRGSAIIGGSSGQLDIDGFYGNSSDRKDAAAGLGGSLIDSIYQIADALGADVNAGRGKVSIGIRKGDIRVDPQGRGYTKTSKFGDIRDFGDDEEAAIRFAISDLIQDGVLSGISDASLNILKSGQELEEAIEKAVLIESVPQLLKQRLDPLGAALDEIDAKFRSLAEALREGGGSAEQIAEARQLWKLEREDAIRQIGDASAQLKDFLLSLNAGAGSPLSLRQQREEAEAALAPFVESIEEARAAREEVERLKQSGASAAEIEAAEGAARAASGGIDQQGFQDAAQLLLGISRQMNASGADFFRDFDRIRALTGGAIDAIDTATPRPGEGSDPFTELTARNTGDIANLLTDTNALLQRIANDNPGGIGVGGSPDWFEQARSFAR